MVVLIFASCVRYFLQSWAGGGLNNMNLGLHLYSNYVCAKLESFYEGVEPVEPFVS